MIETCSWRDLPFLEENRLFLDYIDGKDQALSFYTHGPTDYIASLEARQGYAYPREGAAELLAAYNRERGASAQTMAAIEALREADTYIVIGGQQAGLLGGPVYAAYKILSTIRLARQLSEQLGVTVAPVYWLASEDHDFGEINHAQYIREDGEIGRVSFDWRDKGRPIADLTVTDEVREALDEYWEAMPEAPSAEETQQLFAPNTERYCDWLASLFLRLFADDGLILVEPHVLRPLAGDLFCEMIQQHGTIQEQMEYVAARLEQAGYQALLSTDSAGLMYTFAPDGRRVRIEDPDKAAPDAGERPGRYSTDAALRALFADSVLPVLASTLGAGEIAYQGMLKPLYELFGVPQPLLFPRKSYTIVSSEERERLRAYNITPHQMLADELDRDAILRSRMPAEDLARFDQAREQVQDALAPLKPYLEELDPNMGRTWQQAVNTALRNIDKLEERAINSKLSRAGYSRHELQSLCNKLVPRGRPQERELPLSHFIRRFGTGFVEAMGEAGDLEVFGHDVVTLEGEHA